MTLATNQCWARRSEDAGQSGRTPRGVCEMTSASNLPDEPWESEMSETVAHLVSAFAAVERLRRLTSVDKLATVPCELASQSICTALVALDECGITLLLGAEARGRTPAPRWRESLLKLYSELDLMR